MKLAANGIDLEVAVEGLLRHFRLDRGGDRREFLLRDVGAAARLEAPVDADVATASRRDDARGSSWFATQSCGRATGR